MIKFKGTVFLNILKTLLYYNQNMKSISWGGGGVEFLENINDYRFPNIKNELNEKNNILNL